MNDPVDDTEVLKPALEVALPAATVEVLPYNPVHLQPQDHYESRLRVTYDDGVPRDRTLRIARSVGDDGSRGITTMLFDEAGGFIVAANQRWRADVDGIAHSFMSEWTLFDSITTSLSVEGEHRIETYEVAGDTISLDYVVGAPSQDSARDAFLQFYNTAEWTPAHTLDKNADGSMMMALVNNTSFTRWALGSVRSASDTGPLAKIACDEECHVCAWAGACSYLKCEFGGGIANVICDACVGVSAACFITYLARLFD
ncbi:MAG: hypothetical protein Kow0074_17660 [Candidatus Zixiibacteriota bacterium]